MLNNESCFLEEEEWKEVFRSIIVNDPVLSDRSEVAVSLLIIKATVPGIMRDVTHAVLNQLHTFSPTVENLADRAQQLRTDLLMWRRKYVRVLGKNGSNIHTGTIEGDSRCKTIAIYLSCLMLSNRLIAAVRPSEKLEREKEVQQLVAEIFELQEHLTTVRPQASLFIVQAVGFAHAMAATTLDWQETPGTEGNFDIPERVISRWIFERWCESFGHKIV